RLIGAAALRRHGLRPASADRGPQAGRAGNAWDDRDSRLSCRAAAGAARLSPVAGGRHDGQNVRRLTMRVRRREVILLAALGLIVAWSKPGVLHAVEAPLELQWHNLVPPTPPKPPKPFFSGRGS